MVRECVIPECSTHARFNHPGETHGVYCSKHKEEGMRNVVHKPCSEPGCATLAVFNHPTASTGLYCGQHKPEGFINVKDRKCKYPDCMRMPNFNFPGQKGGVYCSQHREEGMIDIKHKRCEVPNCPKRPSFNYTGEMRALYCGTHKLENMVNVDQERRTCNRAKLEDGAGGREAKRQRTAGYAEKAAGYLLKGANLAAGSEESGGQVQPYDSNAAGQQAADALALGAYAAGGDASSMLLASMAAPVAAHIDQPQPQQQQQQQQEAAAAAAAEGAQQAAAQVSPPFLTEEAAHAGQAPPLPFLTMLPNWPRTESLPDGGQQQQLAGPQLPSPAYLRAVHAADTSPCRDAGGGGAPDQAQHGLAHLMHSHLVEFLRDSLRSSELQGAEDDKAKVCSYVDRFTTWDPATRVEQYTLLHFDWDVAGAGAKWAAVAARIDKALASL